MGSWPWRRMHHLAHVVRHSRPLPVPRWLIGRHHAIPARCHMPKPASLVNSPNSSQFGEFQLGPTQYQNCPTENLYFSTTQNLPDRPPLFPSQTSHSGKEVFFFLLCLGISKCPVETVLEPKHCCQAMLEGLM